jgi:CheY-like chemotaxis protein
MPSPSLTDRLDITVVFTDIDMPGSMNGLKLAAAIRERWPPIEIIVTTAGLAPDLRSLPACAIFLPKPLVPDDAIRTLQSLAA